MQLHARQGLADGADVKFEVELISFDKQPSMVDMAAAERISRARALKDQGNTVFKKVCIACGSHTSYQCAATNCRVLIHEIDFVQAKPNRSCVWAQGVYGHAKNKWLKAMKILGQLFDVDTDEEAAEASAIKASCMVNLALCAQREENFSEALSWCTKALRCCCFLSARRMLLEIMTCTFLVDNTQPSSET